MSSFLSTIDTVVSAFDTGRVAEWRTVTGQNIPSERFFGISRHAQLGRTLAFAETPLAAGRSGEEAFSGRQPYPVTPMGIGGSDMYRQQILDHYKNPRNYGEIEEPTFTHVGENPMCGDEIRMDVVLDDDEETIERVAFRGDGCAISQASASMLSEKLAGMTVEELDAMDRDDVTEMLGVDISPMRVKCAVLAEKVAQDGADIYFGEKDLDRTSTED